MPGSRTSPSIATPSQPSRSDGVVAFRCVRCHRLSYSPSGNCEHGVPEPLVLASERDRYRNALEHIHEHEGKVCAQYDVCEHIACRSSYGAWSMADGVLSPEGTGLEALRAGMPPRRFDPIAQKLVTP